MTTHNLAVAIVFQNQGVIIFADGHIVHPNVDPEPSPWRAELVQEIAAHVRVLEAATHVKDAAVRAELESVATKAIEAKAGALARK